MTLSSPVSTLKGVAQKRAECYEKLGIKTIEDLICHFPRDYVDFSKNTRAAEAPLGEIAVIRAKIKKKLSPSFVRKGMTVYKAVANDGSDDISLIFYNNPYVLDRLFIGREYLLCGKVQGNFTRFEINTPSILDADSPTLFQPVYSLTKGLTNAMIITNVRSALDNSDPSPEFLPEEIRFKYVLCEHSYALANIHFPADEYALELAKKRLAFDELFVLSLGMMLLKRRNRGTSGCKMKKLPLDSFFAALPFEPTNAQKKAISEITADMTGKYPMNRLLQGDVGSGKTAVAAAACCFAHLNGFQSALMAPTEILAQQHFATLTSFLEPLGITVALLTGSMTAKQKKNVKEQLESGAISVIVGTHALISDSTGFSKLGLVIADEQHRFGVNQRARLVEKGKSPHRLVMSATPIPRTLGLIIYGDLDISVLNELPKGRQKIETFAINGKLRSRALDFVKKELDAGHQAYIVCPAIEESDMDVVSAVKYAKSLENGAFCDYRTGLLHGKMPADEKENVMKRFKNGEIDLLVSTTVIEVGVDVPNATVMMIENSDRFGLSQLHQLRGRVGRGTAQSYCILLTDSPTDEVKARLKIMSSTSDGFKIAEEDMNIRGCGDFFGERQHGLPPLKIAFLDSRTLADTQNAANEIIEKSPDLSDYPMLKEQVDKLFTRETPA